MSANIEQVIVILLVHWEVKFQTGRLLVKLVKLVKLTQAMNSYPGMHSYIDLRNVNSVNQHIAVSESDSMHAVQ